ncbi:ras-domain-containing protein [Mytilinidion resinicola]|uniref:Ras-domain-containing protein n=1 Tax=Mytilinidion resinicola TaxID=574789 RepID=A0A6A6YKH7_9PEZI|nr:ras-domain-containing protein [Mytilinidion resinicola]KAF2808465.1 ras-domain-containing protein [Mytilinidion resinicola]
MASGSMPTDKLVVFGEHREDCTALINQFTLNHFVPTYDPTIGDDSFRVQAVIDGKPSLIEVLSTAGQEEYTALRDQYIRDGDGFLVVYSITSRKSFHAVTHYIDQIERVKSPNSQTSIYKAVSLRIMLVGNRCDRVTEREISTQEGYIFAKEHGIDFVEASAKNCINVEKAFYDVVRELRKQRAAAALLVASASAFGAIFSPTP